MAPNRSFWVILIDKTPTAFRGKAREDLVPTLRQLQRTQSGVTLRWFERGRIWESPAAAIGAAKLAATEARERRSKDWRPGGEHRDPKARFQLTRDQKRAKFKRRLAETHSDSPQTPAAPPAQDASHPPERTGNRRWTRPDRGGHRDDSRQSGRPPEVQNPFGRRSPFRGGPPAASRKDRSPRHDETDSPPSKEAKSTRPKDRHQSSDRRNSSRAPKRGR